MRLPVKQIGLLRGPVLQQLPILVVAAQQVLLAEPVHLETLTLQQQLYVQLGLGGGARSRPTGLRDGLCITKDNQYFGSIPKQITLTD